MKHFEMTTLTFECFLAGPQSEFKVSVLLSLNLYDLNEKYPFIHIMLKYKLLSNVKKQTVHYKMGKKRKNTSFEI